MKRISYLAVKKSKIHGAFYLLQWFLVEYSIKELVIWIYLTFFCMVSELSANDALKICAHLKYDPFTSHYVE